MAVTFVFPFLYHKQCVFNTRAIIFYIWVRSCPEKAMAPHSSTLAWKIPWTEEPGRLQSMGSRRVGHNWATSLSLFPSMHWRRKWQPTPVFLPGESQGQRSLVSCLSMGSHRVGHDWSDLTKKIKSYVHSLYGIHQCLSIHSEQNSISLQQSLSLHDLEAHLLSGLISNSSSFLLLQPYWPFYHSLNISGKSTDPECLCVCCFSA